MSQDIDVSTLNSLDLATKCVMSQYRTKAVETSRKYGPGINVFKMLKEPKDGIFNTEYYYSDKDSYIWNTYQDDKNLIGDTHKIFMKYDPTYHYLVAIHVPLNGTTDRSIGRIKIYEFNGNREIVV